MKATHEAAHVVAHIFYGLTFEQVTIGDPEGRASVKSVYYRGPADPGGATADEMGWISRLAKAVFAAQWAEKEEFGARHRVRATSDNALVFMFAEDYLVGPAARSRWMRQQFHHAREDLAWMMAHIRAVAAELVSKRTMTYDEVLEVCRRSPPGRGD